MNDTTAVRPGAQEPGGVDAQGQTEPQPLDLEVAKLTDVGRARPHNEDYVDYYVPPDSRQLARKGAIYLVADGMGGHQAGEVASRGAVELTIGQYYSDTTHDVGTSLVRAFRAANQQLYEQAQADPSKGGMGTTLVAAVIMGRKVYIANVGDSRAYVINARGITQITEDHSWVEEQVRAGLLTPEQARRHPQRNLVTRALGSKPDVQVDLFEGELVPGDMLLLCSDGLTGRVQDQEMATTVREYSPQEAVRLLVALANERGGNDNISVLIVSAQEEAATIKAPVAAPVEKKPSRRSPLIPALVSAAVVLVLVLGALVGLQVLPGLFGSTPTATFTPEASPTILPDTSTPEVQLSVTVETMPSPTYTITATLTPTPTLTPSPTVTLLPSPAPTATSTPTFTPTNTSIPPTATTQPTDTPEATPGEPTPPAPTLLEPLVSANLSGKVPFKWRWDGSPLGKEHFFDLRMWSQQEKDLKMEPRGVITPTKALQAEVTLEGVHTIGEHGVGDYYWTVVVVRVACSGCEPEIIGAWGEERLFHYDGAP